MKQSNIFLPTLRENPSEAEVLSHRLLLRAGYIRQMVSGIYCYLPLAKRVMNRMSQIIREELEKNNAIEIQLPILLPEYLHIHLSEMSSESSDKPLDDSMVYQPTLPFCYQEAVLSLFQSESISYKKLPLILYMIESQLLEEERPRHGLLKSREVLVQSTYSFHETTENLFETYRQMESVYSRILERFGLEYRVLVNHFSEKEGLHLKQFVALSEVGDHTVCFSSASDYIAPIELAVSQYVPTLKRDVMLELEEVSVSGSKTVEEICEYLDIETTQFIKTSLFIADGEPVMALVRGDYKVNEWKLKQVLAAKILVAATDEEIQDILQIDTTIIGPVGLTQGIRVIADEYIQDMENAVTIGNKVDVCYRNVNLGRDVNPSQFTDIRVVKEGETALDGEGTLIFAKGIKVGQLESLGASLSQAMNVHFIDSEDNMQPLQMATYELFLSTLMATIAEQTSDDQGLIWPKAIAPFDIHLLTMNVREEAQVKLTEEIDQLLKEAGYDLLIDDRNESAGVKFNDADLIGIPLRVTIGKKAVENVVEIKLRESGESIEVRKDELISTIEILKNSIM